MSWALQNGEDFSGWETRIFQARKAEAGKPGASVLCTHTGLGHLKVNRFAHVSHAVKGTVVEEVVREDLSQETEPERRSKV